MAHLTSGSERITNKQQQELLQQHLGQRDIDCFISRLNERIAGKNAEIAAVQDYNDQSINKDIL